MLSIAKTLRVLSSSLALATLLSSCLFATQPMLHSPDFDYAVSVPGGTPRGVIVFLHGLSADPWIEEQAGIASLAEAGVARGYVVVVPFAPRNCSAQQRCWPTKPEGNGSDVAAFNAVMPALDRLVRQVERRVGARHLDRSIVGFSNGGFFLAGAVERGLLSGWSRVGIAAGGPLGTPVTTPLAKMRPQIFLESFDDDEWQGPSMIVLRDRLTARGVDVEVHAQPGGHVWSAEHAAVFVDRFVQPR